MGSSSWVHLDVAEIERETATAFYLRLEDGRMVWVPKSQVSNAEDYAKGDRNCTISVSDWIAEQKKLN